MKNLLNFLFLLLVGFCASAQSGKVAGTITDGTSGETLIAAYIYVENTDKIEASDFDGKYSLELEPGTYSLKFTYIGFADKIVNEVEIKENEVTYLDVGMSEGALELEEVVVTAKVIDRTENSVLLLRKKSDQIQDGLSSQEMRRFAVGSVASAVTKVTAVSVEDGKFINIRGLGDRYSMTQLNGLILPSIDPYRNSAQLDLIPTNLLDNIITSKTFSPDQPGTFAGGNLNIKTKSFPEERTLSVSLSAGYNPQNNFINNFLSHEGGDLDWLGYDDGSRARPDFFSDEEVLESMTKNAELKARLQANEGIAQNIQRVVDAIDLDFEPTEINSSFDRGMSVAYGNSWDIGVEGKLGVIASGSYRNSFVHTPDKVVQRWYLSQIQGEALENVGDYLSQESSMNPVVNAMAGIAYKFNGLNSVNFRLMYNHNASKSSRFIYGEKPENIIDPLFFEGRSNVFSEREMLNYQLSGEHVMPSFNNFKIDWSAGYVQANLNSPNMRFFSNQYNAETDGKSIPLSNVEDPLMFYRNLDDNIFNAKIDFELPLNIEALNSTKIKFGGYYSAKDREFDEFRYVLFTPGNNVAQRFNGDFESFLSPDNVGFLGEQEVGTNTRYLIGNYIIDGTDPDNAYIGNEDITSAYLMANLQITPKFKAVGGLRFEYTDIFTESKNEMAPDSLRIGEINVGDFLPSLNLIYNLSDNMNIRGSYNQTLARPNLREIAPFVAFDPLINEFVIGNTQLERTNIRNADLRWEMFLQPGEIISASVFYKYFKNPIVEQYRVSSNPERQFVNVESGDIYGLELELRKSLGFIMPALENLKLNTNIALIQSSQVVNDLTGLEPESRPFTGQAPIILNASLNYSVAETGLDANIAYNYTGDKLTNISREGTPDVYLRARHQLDFILSKRLGPASIRFTAKNLLDSPFKYSAIYDGPDGEGVEFRWSEFRTGIAFGLSLTYNL